MQSTNAWPDRSTESVQIRETIERFLYERSQEKEGSVKTGGENQDLKLQGKYEPRSWIADAARRVSQIQQVTHAIKFSHPDARGSSLSAPGNPGAGDHVVGSHSVAAILTADVVGNAAALDVYKFLRLEVNGRSLLERAIARDPALSAALSDNLAEAESWMTAFATLPEPKGEKATHKLAKQVYWPLEGGGYHLLAPLFPTSLAHAVWTRIRDDRFSERAQAARIARCERRAHAHGYCEYPQLAIQKFGGTKPQNISQLNSERHGENGLLASLPPTWRSPPIRPPFFVESVFAHRFGNRFAVQAKTRTLRDFLHDVPEEKSTLAIRHQRAQLVRDIVVELLQFAAEVGELEAGWSSDARCRLNFAEQCWLDPGRAAKDEAFAVSRRPGEWVDEIGRRFGHWLNSVISTSSTAMGVIEATAWQAVLEGELRMIRRELTEDE